MCIYLYLYLLDIYTYTCIFTHTHTHTYLYISVWEKLKSFSICETHYTIELRPQVQKSLSTYYPACPRGHWTVVLPPVLEPLSLSSPQSNHNNEDCCQWPVIEYLLSAGISEFFTHIIFFIAYNSHLCLVLWLSSFYGYTESERGSATCPRSHIPYEARARIQTCLTSNPMFLTSSTAKWGILL